MTARSRVFRQNELLQNVSRATGSSREWLATMTDSKRNSCTPTDTHYQIMTDEDGECSKLYAREKVHLGEVSCCRNGTDSELLYLKALEVIKRNVNPDTVPAFLQGVATWVRRSGRHLQPQILNMSLAHVWCEEYFKFLFLIGLEQNDGNVAINVDDQLVLQGKVFVVDADDDPVNQTLRRWMSETGVNGEVQIFVGNNDKHKVPFRNKTLLTVYRQDDDTNFPWDISRLHDVLTDVEYGFQRTCRVVFDRGCIFDDTENIGWQYFFTRLLWHIIISELHTVYIEIPYFDQNVMNINMEEGMRRVPDVPDNTIHDAYQMLSDGDFDGNFVMENMTKAGNTYQITFLTANATRFTVSYEKHTGARKFVLQKLVSS